LRCWLTHVGMEQVFYRLSGLQCPVEERQARVHPVIDVGVVVEFLIGVPDAGRGVGIRRSGGVSPDEFEKARNSLG